jgi:hypothetical protein
MKNNFFIFRLDSQISELISKCGILEVGDWYGNCEIFTFLIF